MTTMTMKRYALILAALLPIGFVGITYPRFLNAMRCGRERLLNYQAGRHAVGFIEKEAVGSAVQQYILTNAGELHVQVPPLEAAEVRGGS